MEKDTLELALDRIRLGRFTPPVGPETSLRQAISSGNPDVMAAASVRVHEMSAELATLIVNDARFRGNQVLMIRAGTAGLAGFYPNFVGRTMALKTLQDNSSQAAIAWLMKVLNSSFADGSAVTAFWGARVSTEFQMTPDWRIVPTAALPESDQKRRVASLSSLEAGGLAKSALDFESATCALVKRVRVAPLICTPEAYVAIQKSVTQDYIDRHEIAEELISLLTLVGPRVTIPIAHWVTFDDPDLASASLASGASSHPMIEIIPWYQGPPGEIDQNEARDIAQMYLLLESSPRALIKASIARINQALRRRGTGDRAVEVCTALEILVGDGQPNEVTHKVKVRATRLLGGNEAQRVENSLVLSKVYGLRSQLVHTGRVDEGKSFTVAGVRLSARELVDRAIVLAATLAKLLIRRGNFPKWDHFDVIDFPG